MKGLPRWLGIVLLVGLPGTGSPSSEPADLEAAERVGRIRQLMASSFGGEGPGAALLVMEGEDVVLAEGFGLADLEWRSKVTATTSFRIGSITKSMTAVAVLQLVDQGAVNLDVPISTYLPSLQGAIGKPTVRQLLAHTSGLPDHFSLPQIPAIMRNPISPAEIIRMMTDAEPAFERGTRWQYSNFNYVLLGRLIEVADGDRRSYGSYIEEEIFAPLGMVDSHYDRQRAIIPRRARGYDHDGSQVINTLTVETSLAYAAGALTSSARDLALFTRALRSHALLSPARLREAWTEVVLPDGSPTGYGLGFNVTTFMGDTVVWHSGSINGFQASWLHLPDADRTVAVLSNGFHRPNTTTMARRILAVLADAAVPRFDRRDFVDADWPDLEARYELDDGRILQLHVQDGLRFNIDGDAWAELAWAGDDLFFWPDSLSHLRLTRQGDAISGLVYFTSSLARHAGVRVAGPIRGAQNSTPLDPTVAAGLAGRWLMESGDAVVIAFDGERLSLQIASQPVRRLHFSDAGRYFVRDLPVSMVFADDARTADLIMYGSRFPLTRE